MPKHVDRYIPEHCHPNEVICINCGSIFAEPYSGPRGMSTRSGPFHESKMAIQEARRNAECGAKPKAKLKPGVQPWRPQ